MSQGQSQVPTGQDQDEVTGMVCLESDLQDGQMKEVEVEEQKILLIRTQGQYSAVGSKCSHYGAPLIKGALFGDRVRCPFHGACYNVKTGDIEEYPGLDCLPTYKVKVEDGEVYVSSLNVYKRVKEMSCRVPGVNHIILLIGGGPASLLCAETLRQNHYEGRIIIVTKDTLPPIDKPKLSKAMHLDSASLLLRPMDFFQQHDIELWTQKKMLEENKVTFYMNDEVVEIRGQNGKVKEVVLKSGAVLKTDVVIAGIGVIPNSDFLKGSSVEVDSRKAVIIDKFMRTNIPDVFGAGDVTSFPLALRKDQRVNIGHWQLASAHGRVAALNMLQKQTEIVSVPFFWTVLLGKSIRYTGYAEGYTEIIYKGKVEERKFLAFYIKDDQVVAAASLMFDPAVARVAEIMSNGQVITKAQAQSDDLSWLQM
uniref:Rieske domain-containing protein n=1 Tax=Esox lucius TaxID=8010 RepID=A0A6Q2XEZ3_ESOLU